MLKAKKNSMCIDVTGVDDMTDRHTLMEEIIRRNRWCSNGIDAVTKIIRSATISSNSKTMTCAALHGISDC